MDLSQLVSFIVLTDKPVKKEILDILADCNLYSCITNKVEIGDNKIIQYERTHDGWIARPYQRIETPWVMFLEEDEFLLPEEKQKLLNYLKQEELKTVYVNVERFLSDQDIRKYAWVRTRLLFARPSEMIKKYFTAEIRIISAEQLNDAGLQNVSLKGFADGCRDLTNSMHQDAVFSNITISRQPEADCIEEIKIPDDPDVFKHGHQKYYDDIIYCPSFQWPRTIYSSLRFDYIPSVIQALKEGVSAPEIVTFALVYLIRFRNFETASEIIQLIPDEWFGRHSDLANAVGTILFASGRYDEAMQTFNRALKLFPDLERLAANAIKMYIILGQYEKIVPIENEYQKATGHPLNDDFIQCFTNIHKGFPKRKARVSLCMIIRDEAKYLGRALGSMKDTVDEIIIVDTGSTDDSVSIAEKYGAKVFHLPWMDDFSAARNYAIEKASGDYIFMLDADEYIAPFFFIESKMLMEMLSIEDPWAFGFSIGHYFNVSDWLFMLRDTGNFRSENKSVRLFPRIPGVRYAGLIEESVEESLTERNIPIYLMPDESFHIVHDSETRQERINRKINIYKKEKEPRLAQIIAALKDYSYMNDQVETLYWVRKYQSLYKVDDPKKLRISLHIAKFLETINRDEATAFYNELLTYYAHDYRVLMNFATFLLRENRIHEILELPFNEQIEISELKGKEKLDYNCLSSLKYFESGDTERALETLESVLEESTAHLFAQSLRYYYLISMNSIEGAVLTLNDLFDVLSASRNRQIKSVEDLLLEIEDLCKILLEKGYYNERSIIIRGTLSLEKVMAAI